MHLLSDLITLWKGCEWCIKNIIWGSIPLYNYIIIQERGGAVSTTYLPEKKKKRKKSPRNNASQLLLQRAINQLIQSDFLCPSWRSLNLSKRLLNHPKKVTSRIPRKSLLFGLLLFFPSPVYAAISLGLICPKVGKQVFQDTPWKINGWNLNHPWKERKMICTKPPWLSSMLIFSGVSFGLDNLCWHETG